MALKNDGKISTGTDQSSFMKENSLPLFLLVRKMRCRTTQRNASVSCASILKRECERTRKLRKCLYSSVTSTAISDLSLPQMLQSQHIKLIEESYGLLIPLHKSLLCCQMFVYSILKSGSVAVFLCLGHEIPIQNSYFLPIEKLSGFGILFEKMFFWSGPFHFRYNKMECVLCFTLTCMIAQQESTGYC